jgi:hypothetical protein
VKRAAPKTDQPVGPNADRLAAEIALKTDEPAQDGGQKPPPPATAAFRSCSITALGHCSGGFYYGQHKRDSSTQSLLRIRV